MKNGPGRAVAGEGAQAAGRARRSAPLSSLLMLLTLAALAPILTLEAFNLQAQVRSQRAAEIARLSALAADLARSVDRELRSHIEIAEMLSGSRALQRGDIAEFWDHAEDAASRGKGQFVLVDRSLQQRVNTRAPVRSSLPKTSNPMAAEEIFAGGEARVGNLQRGAFRQGPVFAVRVPVRVGEELRYVLGYAPRENVMREVVDGTYRPEGWFGSVFDANGRTIARSHRHEEFVGREVTREVLDRVEGEAGVIETTDLEGRPSLTAYHASAVSGWTVFVWAPKGLLEKPAAEARRLLLALVALALGASLAAAYVAGRLIRQPVAQVLQAAHGLGRGERIAFRPSLMREANVVGAALEEAGETIRLREAALRENEAHMKLVMRELSHRTKNLLTVIQGIASKSARMSPDFDEFRTSFQNRLMGLGTSHDLLVERRWESVPLGDLVASQLSAFTHPGDGRLTLAGPALPLNPQAAQSLGMALHELATNALKYGALSVPGGGVLVAWERLDGPESEPCIRLRWEERGGPPAAPPARRGFGSLVIEDVVARSLRGETRLDWRPGGLVWEIDAPADFLT